MKSTGVHGTVPNAASGSVYPLYPTGANWQTSVYSLRVFDAGNNYIVNPSWAEIRLYQSNAYIYFSNIPQSAQGSTYWLDFVLFDT